MPRKNDRITYLKEIELEFASGRRSARVSDISIGGCYIDTIAQVPVGEEMTLDLAATDGEMMPFRGRIAYVLDGFGFGVEFIDLNDEQRSFLTRVLSSAGA
jgi:hypothetical protein